MPRPLRYTLIGLLWAAVAGYIVYSAVRVRTHRRQLVVQRLDVEVADSSSHGQLVTGGMVRQWISRSGLKNTGAAAREVDLRALEGLILRNGFVADATASIDYEGVLRITVTQRRPVVRLLFDGYNAYATDEGYLFAAPQSSALYVPVMTGSYAPPVPASYTGSVADYIAAGIAASDARIAEIEREKYPLYRAERENDENIKALRRMTIKKGWLERRVNFDRRVKELREKKAQLRRKYRYTARVLQERIDKISSRQAAEREKQKKLRKNCEDFLKLLNFVVLVEEDDFWRSEIVQIVVTKGPGGAPELELVPRTGSHTVIFGTPDDAEEKLEKLLTFYRRGLRNIGWEEYRTINVKYKEQVVCTK